ncbi:MAG: type II toxin-antitoxin system Phd/YefM family antitoxin [Candidatus Humimicrobiaceae bacterium]
MEKIIGITETRTKIKKIIDSISDKDEAFIITRDSKPAAVIMSYNNYLKTKELMEENWKYRFEKALDESQEIFKKWLVEKGYDFNKLSEEDIERIIGGE